MCSVTWFHDLTGYQLFCNRDERRTRKRALPPRLWERGARFLAPVDGEAGGTWIGVNEHALSVCLLNHEHAGGEAAAATVSRGEVVVRLLEEASVAAAQEVLRRRDLRVHQGFRVLLLAPAQPARLWSWDGRALCAETGAALQMPLVSSARDNQQAFAVRSQLLERLRARQAGPIEALQDFHRSHEPERGPWSPCMHREDAATVSVTRILVSVERVELHYAPGPLCESDWQAALILARTTPMPGSSS